MKTNTTFSQFTNRYSLSKTLRFELKPIGKTLENMRTHLGWNKELQTFLADQEIENAYQMLKPKIDKIHEQFITDSLESEESKRITFSGYLEQYKNKKELLPQIEKQLRTKIGELYVYTSEVWRKEKYPEFEWKRGGKAASGFSILSSSDMLRLIKATNNENGEITKAADKILNGFFTYFGGFNQNRENYYTTKDEKVSAVATRIIHENLPKFCDNLLFFEDRRDEYLNTFILLKEEGKSLVNKEGEQLSPIEESIFQIDHFNACLSQQQIETYNEQVRNANSLINLYNQQKLKEEGFKRLSFFKILYKQIGCGKKDPLFDQLTHDTEKQAKENKENYQKPYSVEQVLHQANEAGKKYFQGNNVQDTITTFPELMRYIMQKKDDNYEGLYWSKAALNTISNKYFSNWHFLKEQLKDKKSVASFDKNREEQIKINEAVELCALFEVLNRIEQWKTPGIIFKANLNTSSAILTRVDTPAEALLEMIHADLNDHVRHFITNADTILSLTEYQEDKNKEQIKIWLDHALAIIQMTKYFLVKPDKIKGAPIDSKIANALEVLHSPEWFDWYDAIRNYLTKKPQDDVKKNKLKLNFENSTLAGGWDINKEPDNYCIILQDKKSKQYLAVIAKQKNQKGYNKIFEKKPDNPLYKRDGSENLQKMEYKLLPGPNKMLPKCLLPKSNRRKYGATDELLTIYDRGSFKKSESNFSTKDLHVVINFYKSALQKYEAWQEFKFQFQETQTYENISQFYNDVEKQGYNLNFIYVNKKILDQWIEDGTIYLFEIKNQDANDGKKNGHLNNLHTIYWKTLFEAIENRPKLNGEAEIFYRKALAENKLEKIQDKQGKEIIKNFRFSKEKFIFHVPITLNFCLKDTKINALVNKVVTNGNDQYYLGLDRGEKHLVYYSLINHNGEIIDQNTFNTINGHNYHDKLDMLEKNRQEARKNWQTIGTIKELKEGYISQVVRKIVDIAIEHNALIILEDLNTGFKRGRQKIEKSVYQKFELAMAKKLNFVVDKTAENGQIGSVTKALQLTPPVTNYGDIEKRKQVGVMFYTRANYTSQTDPGTGWRKTIYLKKGSEEKIKEQILHTFTDFGIDGKDYYFMYNDAHTGKEWKLYAGINDLSLDRYRGARGKDKNEWIVKKFDVQKMLDILFREFDKSESFHAQLIDREIPLTRIEDLKLNPNKNTPWESLRFVIDLIQQIRNTGNTEKDNDFLQSPIRDENNNHFDSRQATTGQPNCGDANGAYNIARKGIIMTEHIKRGYTLYISDPEWDAWLAGKDIWESWIKENEEKLKRKIQ